MRGMAGERKGLSSTALGAPGVVAGERKGLPSVVLIAAPGVTVDAALPGGGGKVILIRGFA